MARIAGINIPQNKLVHIGLTYIYGIGDKFSNQICSSLNIPKKKRVNDSVPKEFSRNWFEKHAQIHNIFDAIWKNIMKAKTGRN